MYSFGFPLFFKRVVVLVSVLCPEEGFLTATSISQDVVARKKKLLFFIFRMCLFFTEKKKEGGVSIYELVDSERVNDAVSH